MHQTIHIFGQQVVDNRVAFFVVAQVHLFYQHRCGLLASPISSRCFEAVFGQKGRTMMRTLLIHGFPIWVRDVLVSQVVPTAPGRQHPHTFGGLPSSLCLLAFNFNVRLLSSCSSCSLICFQ